MDRVENLVAQNFINLDIADTTSDEVDQSTDQNHNIDIEKLLKVNRIAKNCSKNKTYLDFDSKMIENFVTENFMNFDITDIETDRVDQFKETDADFETIQPIFDLDDFYRSSVLDRLSEVDEAECKYTDNDIPVEDTTIDDTDNIKSDIPEHSKNEKLEKSKQEFEEILRCYYGNATKTNAVLNEKEVCNTYNVIEVPIELEGNVKDGIAFNNLTPANAKKDVNKLVTIVIDTDSEISEGEVNCYNEIGNENCLKNETSIGISRCHNIVSSGYLNEIPAKTELPARINNNVIDISFSNDCKKVDIINEPILVIGSDSECEGYHSSDFEFITENEAKKAGLIANNKQKRSKLRQKDQIENHNIPEATNITDHRQSTNNSKYWSKSHNRRLVVDQYYKDLKNNRDNHEIPQGDAYLNMFQGIQASSSMFLENKSVISPACMTIQEFDFEGIRRMGNGGESMDKQLQEQAKENSKRILEKYSVQNRRKRRRF